MLERYKPTWMIESIYDLTPEDLQNHGIKVVMTDLDNTLIAWDNPNGTPELKNWLELIAAASIPVVVVSNNSHERVEKALEHIGLPFVSRALKPFTKGINQVKNEFKMSNQELVLIGDQLMTDIAAANNAGIKSILVKPLVKSDAWNTKPNRFVEKRIKNHLIKKHDFKTKWGNSLDD
ncbi:YqeG family HAD IIIA-type phosphatase [Dellaglioa sp. BT-FLS60]